LIMVLEEKNDVICLAIIESCCNSRIVWRDKYSLHWTKSLWFISTVVEVPSFLLLSCCILSFFDVCYLMNFVELCFALIN
jgi:hypothetical protein